MKHPRKDRPTTLSLDDAPRLVPHAGLPGTDGTSRFCYGFVTEAGAVAAWARHHRKGGGGEGSVSGAAVAAPAEASARAGGAPGALPNLAAPAGAPATGGAPTATATVWDAATGDYVGAGAGVP